MQIRHKSDANPTQILRKSHATLTQIPPTGYYKELPRACFRFVTVAVYAQGPSPHVLFIFTVLLESMPPRGPNAKAKAFAKAQRTHAHNGRRGSRESAMKTMNTLASELSVPVSPLHLRSATGAEVEKRVRLLEARLSSPEQLQRLRSAAKLYVDSGGSFSAPVLPEDHNTPSPVMRHRVLQPSYKLKSKAFMATYNSAQIEPSCWQRFQDFTIALKQKHGARAWAACLEESEHTCGIYE